MSRELVYIIGPYRGDIELNKDRAREAAMLVAECGGFPVVPHLMSEGIEDCLEEEEWLGFMLQVMLRCDSVYKIPGWEHSRGSCEEELVRREHGIPEFIAG